MKQVRGIVTSSQWTFNAAGAVSAFGFFSYDTFILSRCSQCRKVNEAFLVTVPTLIPRERRRS